MIESEIDLYKRTLVEVEKALGNNLMWLTDKLDVDVRQKDEETLRRLKELTDAWYSVCYALAE